MYEEREEEKWVVCRPHVNELASEENRFIVYQHICSDTYTIKDCNSLLTTPPTQESFFTCDGIKSKF